MLPYDQLTRRGQARRLRSLALTALVRNYGLSQPRVRLLSMHSFNTIFRVDSSAGTSVLRVGDAVRIHAAGVEDLEANWLDSLADDGLTPLRNIPTRNGLRWQAATHDGVTCARVCTRFTWVAGTELRGRVDREAATSAGRLLARLHDHAASHSTGSDQIPSQLHARRAIYFGDRDLVADHESTDGAVFVEATARVQQFIDDLWKTGESPHLIHGDFGSHNILGWRNRLQPIDFQDLQFGFAVQELGITITDMRRSTPDLVGPFLDGYRAVRPTPDLDSHTLALLAAGRSLNIMNLALASPSSGIGQTFDSHAARVVDWMRQAT